MHLRVSARVVKASPLFIMTLIPTDGPSLVVKASSGAHLAKSVQLSINFKTCAARSLAAAAAAVAIDTKCSNRKTNKMTARQEIRVIFPYICTWWFLAPSEKYWQWIVCECDECDTPPFAFWRVKGHGGLIRQPVGLYFKRVTAKSSQMSMCRTPHPHADFSDKWRKKCCEKCCGWDLHEWYTLFALWSVHGWLRLIRQSAGVLISRGQREHGIKLPKCFRSSQFQTT